MNGYIELANAIIAQAAKDYRTALNQLSLNPNDKAAQREKKSIERFFHSDWFSILTFPTGTAAKSLLRLSTLLLPDTD